MIALMELLWVGAGSRVAGQVVTRSSMGARAGRFGLEMAEFTAYSYAVEQVVDLWEEQVGDVPDGFEMVLEILIPILISKGSSVFANSLVKSGKAKTISKLPTETLNTLKNMPVITGLRNFVTKQKGVKNFGFVRDKLAKTLSITNSKGKIIFSITPEGMFIDKRITNSMKNLGNASILKNIGILGGTSVGLEMLFGEDDISKTALEYFAVFGHALEEAAGVHNEKEHMIGEIKLGGRWYKDRGDLHREILTNSRSVLTDIVMQSGVSEDEADDIMSLYLTNANGILDCKGIKIIDIIGEVDPESKTTAEILLKLQRMEDDVDNDVLGVIGKVGVDIYDFFDEGIFSAATRDDDGSSEDCDLDADFVNNFDREPNNNHYAFSGHGSEVLGL